MALPTKTMIIIAKSARKTPRDASASLLPVVARSGRPNQADSELMLQACAHSRLLSMTEFYDLQGKNVRDVDAGSGVGVYTSRR